jgi:hypothetical protein
LRSGEKENALEIGKNFEEHSKIGWHVKSRNRHKDLLYTWLPFLGSLVSSEVWRFVAVDVEVGCVSLQATT